MTTSERPTTAAVLSPWLTVREAAARAKCGTAVIYSHVAAGRLRAARLGARGALRFHESWVDAWIGSAVVSVNPDAPGPDVELSIKPFKPRR